MKMVLGYDLNDDISQISYYTEADSIPITISMTAGMDRYAVPTVLAKKKGVNQWAYGEEAVRLAENEEAVLVDHLLKKAAAQEIIVLEDEEFKAVDLLGLYMKRTLSLVNLVYPWQMADEIVITTEQLSEEVLRALREMLKDFPVPQEKIHLQSHLESFFYYTIHQPQELWQYEVLILYYEGKELRSYRMEMNRKLIPVVCMIEQKDYPDLPYQDDSAFMDVCTQLLHNRVVSSVYLIGDGFEGDWAKESLKLLCLKRRVFQGKNLYTKGACYAACDRVIPTPLNEQYIFIGSDKLKYNVGIKVKKAGQEVYESLVDAGQNWYDVHTEYDLMLGKEREIRLLLTPLTGKNARYTVLRLGELPERPERATRLRLRLSMHSEDKLHVKVYDQGFGEIFPSSGLSWEEDIVLYEE